MYEILSATVIYSWANARSKIKFLFNMFDFQCRGRMSTSEVTIMFLAIARGIGLMTNTKMPDRMFFEDSASQLFRETMEFD
jgi:hypothetical protein